MNQPLLSHKKDSPIVLFFFCRDGSSTAAMSAGVALSVPSGAGTEISCERGGETWARVPGFESVQLVAPRWED